MGSLFSNVIREFERWIREISSIPIYYYCLLIIEMNIVNRFFFFFLQLLSYQRTTVLQLCEIQSTLHNEKVIIVQRTERRKNVHQLEFYSEWAKRRTKAKLNFFCTHQFFFLYLKKKKTVFSKCCNWARARAHKEDYKYAWYENKIWDGCFVNNKQ